MKTKLFAIMGLFFLLLVGGGCSGSNQTQPRPEPGNSIAVEPTDITSPNDAQTSAQASGVMPQTDPVLAPIIPTINASSKTRLRGIYLTGRESGNRAGVFAKAASKDQDRLAIYAAQRGSDNALTLIVINKTNADLVSNIQLANFKPAATASVYRYSGVNLGVIVKQPDQDVGGQGFEATFPTSSISLIVIPVGN